MSTVRVIDPNTGNVVELDSDYVAGQNAAGANYQPAPAGPAPEKPPPPDAWPGWKYQAGTNSWVIPGGRQTEYDAWVAGNNVKAAGTDYAQNAPAIDTAKAAGFDPTKNIADQRTGEQNGTAGGMPVPTVDQTQIVDARATRDQALADQRRVLEKALNLGPDPVEQRALQQRFFERGLGNANTVASNARGGAGAVAAARGQVINQTPRMMGEAADAARSEELAMFNQRVQGASAAGNIANTIGQTATNAFGQETNLAVDVAQTGLQAIDRIQAETGMKINADLQQQQQLGTMLQDIYQLGYNYAALDVGVQQNIFDEISQSHHIDQQTAAQLKAIAAQKKMGVMDYVMGFLGAGEKGLQTAGALGWSPLGGSGGDSAGGAGAFPGR